MAERSDTHLDPVVVVCKAQVIDLTFYWSLANVNLMRIYGGSF